MKNSFGLGYNHWESVAFSPEATATHPSHTPIPLGQQEMWLYQHGAGFGNQQLSCRRGHTQPRAGVS